MSIPAADSTIPAKKRQGPAVTWRVAYASVTGRGHLKAGTRCQDAAAVCRVGGATAICVCDGAGSAPRSHLGAAAVAEAIAAFLAIEAGLGRIGKLTSDLIVAKALQAIEQVANENGGEWSDYACTLLGLAFDGDKVLTIHLGDGVIAAVQSGFPYALSKPDNGEFANETFFVTSPDAVERTRLRLSMVPPEITSFALMTDGAQASLYNRLTGEVSRAVEQMASWLDEDSEESVANSLRQVIARRLAPRTHDDCTVVVVRRARSNEAVTM